MLEQLYIEWGGGYDGNLPFEYSYMESVLNTELNTRGIELLIFFNFIQ